jgi:hypothetical protein
MAEPLHDTILDFCPRCFATDLDGSWEHTVVSGHCTNCGSGGTVKLAKWAVDSIRQQASWVGKRYYPIKEDTEQAEELKLLRNSMTVFPGRTIEHTDLNQFRVTQKTGKNSTIVTFVTAKDIDEAWEKSKSWLPYVPQTWE